MGKVIGKRGMTAKIIRTTLNATFGKFRKRYILEIVKRWQFERFSSETFKTRHVIS